jgi:integral membrane protein (TIGR01906 family)
MEVFSRRIAFWVIFITLPIIIILTSVEIVAFNIDFYDAKYDKYNVVENTGIEKDELMDITEELLAYLKGERQDLELYGEVHGDNRLIFDERDQAHMVDVQELFVKGIILRNVAFIIFFIATLYLVLKKYRQRVARAVFLSLITSTAIIILLGIIISTDFSKYFDIFHYIFFDNDLWRLDPKKSILINLVPLGFFMDIVIKLSIYIFGSFGAGALLSGRYLRKNREQS